MVKLNRQSGKAIIWGRVSTTQQEVETQVAELKAMAIADGYEEENLITIKSEGASAIKQNELYKREVNNLITTLDNDSSIKCVYVWEVSRIARVELTFFQMKDYFVKNKIQFINKIGYIDNSYWLYDTRKCGARGAKLYMVDANGAKLDVSDYVRKNKRFIRKYK